MVHNETLYVKRFELSGRWVDSEYRVCILHTVKKKKKNDSKMLLSAKRVGVYDFIKQKHATRANEL